jgi:hypothetical protein
MKEKQGFIALTSVLVLSAVFLSITISVASGAIDALTSLIAYTDRDQAKYFAEACADHALLELVRTLHYEGDEVILVEGGSCAIATITSEGDERIIHTSAVVGSHAYTLEVRIDSIAQQSAVTTYERIPTY